MKKAVTLKKNYEFRRLYTKGKSALTPFLVLYCRPNRLGTNRLGITVGAKLGCAVARNRVRRRFRELYRLSQGDMKQGYDFVLVARHRAVGAPWKKLSHAWQRAVGELGLWREAVK